jgi:hypothetical protein
MNLHTHTSLLEIVSFHYNENLLYYYVHMPDLKKYNADASRRLVSMLCTAKPSQESDLYRLCYIR